MHERQNRVWIRLWLLGMLWSTLFFSLRTHSSTFDDAYITYRYARNIASGQGFTYNKGEMVLGTTTPLYTLLLAGLSRLWSDIPKLSHYISSYAWLLCIPVLYRIGRSQGHEEAGLAASAVLSSNALFVNALGMETSLYILLILLTFYFYLHNSPNLASLCAGLAFVARWDGVLVVGVFLFAEFLRHRWRMLYPSLICILIILTWLTYSHIVFGSIFPNTFFAKVGQSTKTEFGGEMGAFAQGIILYASEAYNVSQLFILLPLFGATGIVIALARKVHWWPILLWTTGYAVGYTILGVLRFAWYYPPLIPALALLVGAGISGFIEFVASRWQLLKTGNRRQVMATLLIIAVLVPNLLWLNHRSSPQIDQRTKTYIEVGQWLNTHTPVDSSVALLEIGIIGYYSNRTVVDTMGLVTPAMIGHLDNWLQTLIFAVNYSWPDYIVALRNTAWDAVISQTWFEEAYILEAQIINENDSISPVKIFKLRPEFPPHDFASSVKTELNFDKSFVLHKINVELYHILQGDNLQIELVWEALVDVNAYYRLDFELENPENGNRWQLAGGLLPLHGGNPTSHWRQGDWISDFHSLTIWGDIPPGIYQLHPIIRRANGEIVTGIPLGDTLFSEIPMIDVQSREPQVPLQVLLADNIMLTGYDTIYNATEQTLVLTLYWQTTHAASKDYTIFVHLISPEGQLVGQHDGPPRRPTQTWGADGREIDPHTLSLPDNLSPGTYKLRVGLYPWPDLERLPVLDAGGLFYEDNALQLTEVTIP